MKARPTLQQEKNNGLVDFKVIGVELKAESKQERFMLQRLCEEYPKAMVPTTPDFNYIALRFRGYEVRRFGPDEQRTFIQNISDNLPDDRLKSCPICKNEQKPRREFVYDRLKLICKSCRHTVSGEDISELIGKWNTGNSLSLEEEPVGFSELIGMAEKPTPTKVVKKKNVPDDGYDFHCKKCLTPYAYKKACKTHQKKCKG